LQIDEIKYNLSQKKFVVVVVKKGMRALNASRDEIKLQVKIKNRNLNS